MMGFVKKRGESIDRRILDFLKKKENPVSTREIALALKISWHTIINHCLRLQMNNKVFGYRIGNLNVWVVRK